MQAGLEQPKQEEYKKTATLFKGNSVGCGIVAWGGIGMDDYLLMAAALVAAAGLYLIIVRTPARRRGDANRSIGSQGTHRSDIAKLPLLIARQCAGAAICLSMTDDGESLLSDPAPPVARTPRRGDKRPPGDGSATTNAKPRDTGSQNQGHKAFVLLSFPQHIDLETEREMKIFVDRNNDRADLSGTARIASGRNFIALVLNHLAPDDEFVVSAAIDDRVFSSGLVRLGSIQHRSRMSC